MKVTAQSLEEQYRAKPTEELIVLQRRGEMTELASRVLGKELERRGVAQADVDQVLAEEAQHSRERDMAGLAPLHGRLIARAMDLFIVLLLSLLPNIFFVYDPRAHSAAEWLALSYFLLADALPNGQSLGKKVTGIAVADVPTGRPCTLIRSAIRNVTLLLMVLDWAPALGSRRRRGGDWLAGTIVVYSRR